ncbi:MAG: hypothetical protein ACYTGP_08670 [Planctomycetota bacterium]|jgi:hypothetical protein
MTEWVVVRTAPSILAALIAWTSSQDPPTEDAGLDLAINNPGSIAERLRRDEEPKEYLFPTPVVSDLLVPWYELKAGLEERHGLRFGISATHLYQWASDTVGPQDDASGFDVTAIGTWTFLGRDTGSPTTPSVVDLDRETRGFSKEK